jgi:hypothetical protein
VPTGSCLGLTSRTASLEELGAVGGGVLGRLADVFRRGLSGHGSLALDFQLRGDAVVTHVERNQAHSKVGLTLVAGTGFEPV